MTDKRINWIDITKGVGIILVVLGHVYQNETTFNWIYSFHMPLFFMVSGYLYKKKPIIEDLKRRLDTIVIPYLSFGFLVLIYWVLIERKFRYSTMGVIDSALGLLRGQYEFLDFNVHLWFLPCFFITLITYNILMNLFGKKWTYVIVASMSIVYLGITIPSLPWGIDRMFQYIFFVMCGDILSNSKVIERFSKHKPQLISGGSILLVVSFVLNLYFNNTGLLWFAFGTIGCFGVISISLAIEKNVILEHMGRISLIVLCVHGPVYRVVIKLMSILFHQDTEIVRANFLYASGVVLITLFICCVIYKVVLQTCPIMLGKNKRKVEKSIESNNGVL